EEAEGRALQLLRRLRARLREPIGEHDSRIADRKLGVPDLPARGFGARELLRPKRPLVELDRLRRVVNGEVRAEGVVALGNRLDSQRPPFPERFAAARPILRL